jgi:hypothetical protein
MVGHGGRPAHGAEEDGVHAADLRLPVVRHHLAGLGVPVAAGPVDGRDVQRDAEALRGRFEHAQALGHHFLADAVAGDGGNEEPLEKQLWKAADKLRKNIDAAEYKHIVLGLVFLKYISDAFVELYAKLKAEEANMPVPTRRTRTNTRPRTSSSCRPARWSFLLQSQSQAAHHRQNGG